MSVPFHATDDSSLSVSPWAESIRGVKTFLMIPVMLYTNLPMMTVLYLSLPDGVSATIG